MEKKVQEKKQIQSLLYAINYIQHQNYLCTWVGVSDGGFQQPTVVFCRIRWDDLHARHLAVPCTKTLRMLSTYACGGTIGPTEYNRYRHLRGFRQTNVDIKAIKRVLWLVTVSPLLIWKLGTTVSIYSCAAKFFAHFFLATFLPLFYDFCFLGQPFPGLALGVGAGSWSSVIHWLIQEAKLWCTYHINFFLLNIRSSVAN